MIDLEHFNELPLQVSNLEPSDPESDALPVELRGIGCGLDRLHSESQNIDGHPTDGSGRRVVPDSPILQYVSGKPFGYFSFSSASSPIIASSSPGGAKSYYLLPG